MREGKRHLSPGAVSGSGPRPWWWSSSYQQGNVPIEKSAVAMNRIWIKNTSVNDISLTPQFLNHHKIGVFSTVAFPIAMYGCDSWTIKKAEHWRTDAFKLWCWRRFCARRSNQSVLKEINWIFIGRTDAEVPRLWPPDAKSWIIDAGKDWGQEEKGSTVDEMIGWHHWLNGHEFEQTPGDSEGQGSLMCCSPWGCRVRHDLATEQQQQQSLIHHKYSINK